MYLLVICFVPRSTSICLCSQAKACRLDFDYLVFPTELLLSTWCTVVFSVLRIHRKSGDFCLGAFFYYEKCAIFCAIFDAGQSVLQTSTKSHNQKFTGQGIVKKSLFAGQKSWKTDLQPSSSWKLPRKLLVCILMIILRTFLQVKCPAVYFSDFFACMVFIMYSLINVSIFLTPRHSRVRLCV